VWGAGVQGICGCSEKGFHEGGDSDGSWAAFGLACVSDEDEDLYPVRSVPCCYSVRVDGLEDHGLVKAFDDGEAAIGDRREFEVGRGEDGGRGQ